MDNPEFFGLLPFYMEKKMEIVTSTEFVSNFVLLFLISALIEALDKGKTFGGFFMTRLAGVRWSTFATWLILCGVLGMFANFLGKQTNGVVASIASIFVGVVCLLIIDVVDKISPRMRHKWPE